MGNGSTGRPALRLAPGILGVVLVVMITLGAWTVGRMGARPTAAHAETPVVRPKPIAGPGTRPEQQALSSAPISEAVLAELVREIRLLREEIGGLRSGEPTRVPVATDTSVQAEQLGLLVARLEAAVATSDTSRRPLFLPGTEKRTAELLEMYRAYEEAHELDQYGEFERRFFFWSYQDVLDQFGIPDDIHIRDNGTVSWSYEHDSEDESAEYDVDFRFHDGRVVGL